METVLNLKELCLTYATSVNEFSTNSIQIQQKKPHWYGANIYVVSCISKLSATSGKFEMHTLRTLVNVSLLCPLPNSTLVKCMFSRYECMFFVFAFCNLFKQNTIVKLVTSSTWIQVIFSNLF